MLLKLLYTTGEELSMYTFVPGCHLPYPVVIEYEGYGLKTTYGTARKACLFCVGWRFSTINCFYLTFVHIWLNKRMHEFTELCNNIIMTPLFVSSQTTCMLIFHIMRIDKILSHITFSARFCPAARKISSNLDISNKGHAGFILGDYSCLFVSGSLLNQMSGALELF